MDGSEIFFMFIVIFFGSLMITNFVVTVVSEPDSKEKKPKGDRLKKARERALKKMNDRKIKEYIKKIKIAYKNGKKWVTIYRFNVTSEYDGDYISAAIYKWLDANNIKYHTQTGPFENDIWFDKEE